MKNKGSYKVEVYGCGTVGYWTTLILAHNLAAASMDSLTLIDRDHISEANAITCPQYSGHVGWAKTARLGEIARPLLGSKTRVRAFCKDVQCLDWSEIVGNARQGMRVAIIGLDDWQARLTVIEGLRVVASEGGGDALVIQVGLDKDQAGVCVFGCEWNDPCPACGLPTLPANEPCVVQDPERRLLRGNLQREAQAAAALVCQIIAEHCNAAGSSPWTNTKTNLIAVRPGVTEFRHFRRARMRMSSCLGPHSAQGPINLSGIVQEVSHGR